MNIEFSKMDIKEQIKFINSKTISGMTVINVAKEIGMSDKTLRKNLKAKNYIFDRAKKIYLLLESNESTTKENSIDFNEVIQNNNKNINVNKDTNKVLVVKNESNPLELLQEFKIHLEDVKELLGMKAQIKEIIQNYNKNIITETVEVQQELKIDKDKLHGELKSRLIKVYDNVNVDWIMFCKNNNQFKMQDLCSIALLEFIEKYSNK